jgi:hypothetical protein
MGLSALRGCMPPEYSGSLCAGSELLPAVGAARTSARNKRVDGGVEDLGSAFPE